MAAWPFVGADEGWEMKGDGQPPDASLQPSLASQAHRKPTISSASPLQAHCNEFGARWGPLAMIGWAALPTAHERVLSFFKMKLYCSICHPS